MSYYRKTPISNALAALVVEKASRYAHHAAIAVKLGLEPDQVTIADLLAHSEVMRALQGQPGAMASILDRVDGPQPKTLHVGGAVDAPALSFRFVDAEPPQIAGPATAIVVGGSEVLGEQ